MEKVLFHGGCHGCTQQEIHGVDFCCNCRYFEPDWSKPSLNNKPLDRAAIVRAEVRARRNPTG